MKKLIALVLLVPLWTSAQEVAPTATGQNNRTTVINVIIKDATSIFESPQDTVDLNYIRLRDHQHGNPNGATGIDIKEYRTNVYQGEQAIWIISLEGVPGNQGYSAELTQIHITGGTCIFDTDKIPGNSPIIIGRVVGGEKCGEEAYAINFMLQDDKGDVRTLVIDPILKPNN